MPDTYRLDNLSSDLSGGADFSKKLLKSGYSTATLTVTIASSATETSYGFTEVGEPGVQGTSTGNFTVEIDGTTGSASIEGSVSLSRVNAAGSVQATSSATAEQTLNSGGGVRTFSLTNPALGTWAAGDRLRVNYIFRNTNTMGTSSIDLPLGSATVEVTVPWTYVPAGGDTDKFFAMFE